MRTVQSGGEEVEKLEEDSILEVPDTPAEVEEGTNQANTQSSTQSAYFPKLVSLVSKQIAISSPVSHQPGYNVTPHLDPHI